MKGRLTRSGGRRWGIPTVSLAAGPDVAAPELGQHNNARILEATGNARMMRA